MLVMVTVPLAGEVVVRVGQPFEKTIGLVEPDSGSPLTLPAVVANLVHCHLPQPCPERAFALPLNRGISRKTTTRTSWARSADSSPRPERDRASAGSVADRSLEPVPVGGLRPGHLEPIEQAEGRWVHVDLAGSDRSIANSPILVHGCNRCYPGK